MIVHLFLLHKREERKKKKLTLQMFSNVCKIATLSLALLLFYIANPIHSLNFLLTSVAVTKDRFIFN